MQLGLQLLLAHIAGDFLFPAQSRLLKQLPITARHVLWYVLIHAIALALAFQLELRYWPAFLFLLCTYIAGAVIAKSSYGRSHPRASFFLLQAFYVASIIGVALSYAPFRPPWHVLFGPDTLLLALALLMVTVVSATIIKVLIGQWPMKETSANDSLPQAGLYIGILERLFVFTFVVMGQWQAIGFLLAAKSVFRFGDLSKSKDRKLTEYILIGTLLSFGLALCCGLLYLFFKPLLLKQGPY